MSDTAAGAASPELFLLESDGPITTLTFNRPERRNGLNPAVMRELEEILHRIRDDRQTRALIITGAGTVFCAGAEPAAVTERAGRGDLSGGPGGPRVIGRLFDTMAHLEVMTVAAINGHAIGGGWSLALAADYCLAVPAAQFWVPEVELGVPFRGLSSFALTHRLGPWLAKEAVILCRHFGADELRQLGVINRVVEPDQLMIEARRIAEKYAAMPAKAANATKRDVNTVIYGPRHY
jgi:enoyl-CoA hydratase/carnithine racemase